VGARPRRAGSKNKQQQRQRRNAGVLRSAQNDNLFTSYSIRECCLGGGRLLELYAVFADDGEYGQEIGEAKELANPLAYVEELHLASCGAG
jgi:hypothetical protein